MSPEKAMTTFTVTTTVPGFVTAAEIISKLREEFHGVTYDVSTPSGMAKAVEARRKLREARIALDKKKPEVKREALDFCNKVEADYKMLRAAVSEYEDIPDAAIKAEEERKEKERAEKARVETERIAAIRARIDKIKSLPLLVVNFSVAELQEFTEKVRLQPIGVEFAEFAEEAVNSKAETMETLNNMLVAKQIAEEESAKIKAEYEAEAARLEEERQRLETERIEREKVEAEERERIRAEQEAEAARLAAEREELDRQREVFAAAQRQKEADEKAQEKVNLLLSAVEADALRPVAEETITIPKSEYDQLLADSKLLNILRGAGVDNWDGWDLAMEALEAA